MLRYLFLQSRHFQPNNGDPPMAMIIARNEEFQFI